MVTRLAILGVLRLADSSAPATPELVETLGDGWIAEEALAIALFCALRAESFEHAVKLAANHSGDSDSTASLTGQLLGTEQGADAIPASWREAVELRDVIEAIADDLWQARKDPAAVQDRYPGW